MDIGLLNRRLFTALCILAIAFGSARGTDTGEEEREKGGWIVSGKRSAFAPSPVVRHTPLPGRLTTFSPAREVRSILSFNDTIWIGTEGGLFAYDAAEDTVSAVHGPFFYSIRSIAVDDAGSLWIGGEGGISIRGEGKWRHYDKKRKPFFERVRDVVHGDGRMWIASYGNGCAYVMDDSITIYTREDSLLDDRVLSIAEETPSSIWFGTASGLCMTDTLQWASMRYGNRIPIGAVRDIIFDEGGNLFLAVAGQGVILYSLGRVKEFGPHDGLPSWEINAFSLDPTGRVWAAGRSGLSIFDGTGWTPYRMPGVALERFRFLSISHDLEGTSYAGTDEGTVLVLSRDNVGTVYIPQGFPHSRVAEIRMQDDALWFLTVSSIFRLDGSMSEVEPPAAWCAGAMTDLYVDSREEIWVTTRFGILHFHRNAWEIYDRRQGLPTEYFNHLSRDSKGHMWFGTFDAGILEFTGSGWVHYTEEQGLPDNRITGLVVDKSGDPWIVSIGDRVARFSGGEWEEIPLPNRVLEAETETPDTLLRLDPAIRFISTAKHESRVREDENGTVLGLDGRGRCIVAGRDGICILDGAEWRVIDPPKDLADAMPTAVLGTSRGEIWLGTDAGAFVLRNGTWHRISALNGLADDHILAITEDAQGRIWLGTQFNGIVMYQ